MSSVFFPILKTILSPEIGVYKATLAALLDTALQSAEAKLVASVPAEQQNFITPMIDTIRTEFEAVLSNEEDIVLKKIGLE
jgi:hypothetical protein